MTTPEVIEKRDAQLNGHKVRIGRCSICRVRVFADKKRDGDLIELDGDIHVCATWIGEPL